MTINRFEFSALPFLHTRFPPNALSLQVSLPTQYNSLNQDPVGALSSTFARLQSSKPLRELRESAKAITKQMPVPVQEVTAKVDEYARGMISGSGSTLFEELGLYYIGTVDGHNLQDLVAILEEVKSTRSVGPVLIHIVTEKGRGYSYAEAAQDKYHGVSTFDVASGKHRLFLDSVQKMEIKKIRITKNRFLQVCLFIHERHIVCTWNTQESW